MAIRACRVEELSPGSRIIVQGGRFGIGVFNSDGALYALANRCPHDGAPVCLGPVTGTTSQKGRTTQNGLKMAKYSVALGTVGSLN